jgi:hypothetical protein
LPRFVNAAEKTLRNRDPLFEIQSREGDSFPLGN